MCSIIHPSCCHAVGGLSQQSRTVRWFDILSSHVNSMQTDNQSMCLIIHSNCCHAIVGLSQLIHVQLFIQAVVLQLWTLTTNVSNGLSNGLLDCPMDGLLDGLLVGNPFTHVQSQSKQTINPCVHDSSQLLSHSCGLSQPMRLMVCWVTCWMVH